MTLQGPFKSQPKVEQHHLVRFIPKLPAPEGCRLSPVHILALRRACWMPTAHQPPVPAPAHLALVSRYKEEN